MITYRASKILPYNSIETGLVGVILPQSSKILDESEIDSKIEKTKNHIIYLSNIVSQKKTNGNKRFRVKQMTLRNQIDLSTRRLTTLYSAKEIIINANKSLKLLTVPSSNQDFTSPARLGKILGRLNSLPQNLYTEAQYSFSSIWGSIFRISSVRKSP